MNLRNLTRNQKIFVGVNLTTIIVCIALIRLDIFNAGRKQTSENAFEVWLPTPIVLVYIVSGILCELTEKKRKLRSSPGLVYIALSAIVAAIGIIVASIVFWTWEVLLALIFIAIVYGFSYFLIRLSSRKKIKDINTKDAFK